MYGENNFLEKRSDRKMEERIKDREKEGIEK
jgi:hypothetical protein